MNFLEYISSFANDGETTLIVKQKNKAGGKGYTWPAYLPSKWIDGPAWYGNTGLFITERFTKGYPTASAACCDFVCVMVLDDVGTKSKTPPLLPTWIMETSPGNFQYGYGFCELPRKEVFSAAIVAIAAAGYTDPGAINPVRNFRLPGSPNLKPGRDGFKSRLVEFHPEREYTLDQVCTALGVTPAPADTASHRPLPLLDDGTDVVVAWLVAQGYALEGANGSGWMGVVCPNAAEHTDGNPMGRFHPVHHSYCCLHAHCCDWNSERYLEWVAAQGGPVANVGLRGDLLAAVMAPTLAKIDKTDSQFSEANEVAAVVAEVEQKQAGRHTKEVLHDKYVYIEQDNAYFDLETRQEIAKATFDALYAHLDCRRGKNRISASQWFNEHRNPRGGKTVAGVTYAAGEAALCSQEGMLYGNRWRDARTPGRSGNVTRWLDLIDRLYPESFEREHLLNVLAYKVQHPERKINHAILMGGATRIGKDTIMAPFWYAVGGQAHMNKSMVDSHVFESQFHYWLESEIILINELRPDQFRDRRALENTLKPVIAAPPEYLTVNRKGLAPTRVLNRALVVAFSNFRDAIALPHDDQRWFVIWSPVRDVLAQQEAVDIWSWYQEQGGFDACCSWLRSRDVSKFNPAAAPPMTEAKAIMVEQARTSQEDYLIFSIQNKVGPFSAGVIGPPFHRIADYLQASAPVGTKVNAAALHPALMAAGWLDLGHVHSRKYPTKKRVYCLPEYALLTNTQILDMLAEKDKPAAHLSLVAPLPPPGSVADS